MDIGQDRRTHLKAIPGWLAYIDLACATLAGGVWYAFPQAGPWPLVIALPPWLARLVLSGRLTCRTPFELPLLLFLLTAGVGVWAAYDRQVAWTKFWLIVGGGLLFYALVNAKPIGDARVWLLAFFGAGVALYFLATHDWDAYAAKIDALTQLGRVLQAPLPALPGHRLNPNVVGGIIATMTPYAGWVTMKAWQGLRWSSRPLSLACWLPFAAGLGTLALTLFGLVMTVSRGAWIALGVALLLVGLWTLSNGLSRRSAERRTWVFPGLLVLVLILTLGAGMAWSGGITTVLEALPGGNSVSGRVDLLRNTLTLARDYPFIGAGLGGYQMLYSTYALLIHVGFAAHSHVLLLDITLEQGLPAILALVWMWLLFAAAVWRGLFRSRPGLESSALGPAVLSLLVMLVHGLVGDVFYASRAVLLLFVPLAFAVPLTQEPRQASRWTIVGLPVGIALLLLLALVWREPLLSRLYSNLGAVHQSQAELGVYSWPTWPIQDAVRREVDLSQPVAEFERALALDPRNATANRRLGMIELSLGEYEDALAHLEVAYAVEPGSVTTRQLYGEALIVNGRVDEGRALWSEFRTAQGQLDARAYWYRHIGDSERAAWVRQAVDGR